MIGIDVSSWQKNINWDSVKSQIYFAILRLGYIGNNEVKLDDYFERNYSECKRLGIPVGVYIYNYVKTIDKVKECANWVVEKLNGKSLELPVYIDMEDKTLEGLGKETLTNICIAFNTIIESTGRWAGVYANRNWYDNYLNKDEIKARYTTWIAHYGVVTNKYEGQYDILQYSDTGKVTGVNGNTDMNIMYRDLIKEISGSTPVKPSKSIDELANEVINGQWGNGDERKQRLTNAGYDYNAVQEAVNNKLGYKPKTLEVGTRVKAIANGNGASDGSGVQAAKDITGYIERIISGAKYPYLVSNISGYGPIGWYKADALKII